MDCKIKNDIGTIYITEDVLLKVVGYAALECYGIVAMSSKRAKDGIVEWLGRENLSKGVQIRSVGDMLDVDLFIIVEYGIATALGATGCIPVILRNAPRPAWLICRKHFAPSA